MNLETKMSPQWKYFWHIWTLGIPIRGTELIVYKGNTSQKARTFQMRAEEIKLVVKEKVEIEYPDTSILLRLFRILGPSKNPKHGIKKKFSN